jgi:hypothetical protein
VGDNNNTSNDSNSRRSPLFQLLHLAATTSITTSSGANSSTVAAAPSAVSGLGMMSVGMGMNMNMNIVSEINIFAAFVAQALRQVRIYSIVANSEVLFNTLAAILLTPTSYGIIYIHCNKRHRSKFKLPLILYIHYIPSHLISSHLISSH